MTNNTMKITVKILITAMLWVSLSGCEWFNHAGFGVNGGNDGWFSSNEIATDLITHGGTGYVVLIGNMKFDDDSTNYDFKDIEDKSMPIEIITDDLIYNPDNKENIITIKIKDEEIDVDLNSHGTCIDGFWYDEEYYTIGEIFKLDDSDTLFVDFVCSEPKNTRLEFGLGENRYPTPLTSSQIEDSIRNGNYEITYIDLSYTPNALPRECYIIDGKIYTKSMLGDRWIYLCEQLPPLGYDETINEKHMIAMLTLNKNKGNGFNEKHHIVSIRSDGYYKNWVECEYEISWIEIGDK